MTNEEMEVRAKKSLGQHFLTDLSIAKQIADALLSGAQEMPGNRKGNGHEPTEGERGTKDIVQDTTALHRDTIDGNGPIEDNNGPVPENGTEKTEVLEVGPGMGVLTQYLLQRSEIDLKMVEIDRESVDYLLMNFPQVNGRLIEADFLKLKLENFFNGKFCIIGNFPYNISSQIFFKVLDYKDSVPQVVCMIQKEVAERIAEQPGTKTYGILSVLLQAWYDIEYLFTVGEGAFNPPPKVKSAVIRLTRNSRTDLGCDESLFKAVVKTAFNQRRKTMRNSLKPMITAKAERENWNAEQTAAFSSDPVFDLRPERLGVEEFISLTLKLS